MRSKSIVLGVCFLLVVLGTAKASVQLGSCEMSCGRNEEMIARAREVQGPPGKQGQKGTTGDPGPPGVCDLVTLQRLQSDLKNLYERAYPRDCVDVKKFSSSNGIYTIHPSGITTEGFQVYCDQITDGGGWIVIQRRMDGSEDFYRGWEDYVRGFGHKEREFWLGLEAIYGMTVNRSHAIRFDFITKQDQKLFAKYSEFGLSGEDDNYRLSIGGYSGNAGDSMAYHKRGQFSTKDRENDESPVQNCAIEYRGGWWYKSCHLSNLNAPYDGIGPRGMSWHLWKNSYESFLKFVEIKIKRL